MSVRDRIDRFVNPKSGPSGSFSSDLLLIGRKLLEDSLLDRKNNLNTPPNNHMSKHSVGSIVLLVAGFECWLNEAIDYLSSYDPKMRAYVELPVLRKYESLCNWNGTDRFPLTNVRVIDRQQGLNFEDILTKLPLVVEVRNEIVHAVPVPTGTPWNLPPKLLPLHEMGVLMTTGKAEADYTLHDKFRSYALAYWCWEQIDTAVSLLVNHVEPDQVLAWTAQNFSASYRAVCPPKELASHNIPDV